MWVLCQWIKSSVVPEVLLCSLFLTHSKESLQEDPACLQDIGDFNNGAHVVLWSCPVKSSGLVFSICFHSGQVHVLLIYYCLSSAWQEHWEAPPVVSSCPFQVLRRDTYSVYGTNGWDKKSDEVKGFRQKIKSSNASRFRWNPALMSVRVLPFISMWPGFLSWLTCPKL